MLNHDNIYVILFSLPIYQLLFYTVQLVTLKKTSPSRRYLGLLTLVLTAFLIMNAVHHLGYERLFSWMYLIFIPVLLAAAPACYFYILSLVHEDRESGRRQVIAFFLPSILVLLGNIFIYGLLPAETRMIFITKGFRAGILGFPGLKAAAVWFWTGSVALLALQIVLVTAMARRELKTVAARMERQPERLAYLESKWVYIIAASTGVFLILNGIALIPGHAWGIGLALSYNLLMLIAGGMAGFYGMKQNSLLEQVSRVGIHGRPSGRAGREAMDETRDTEKMTGFILPEEAERIRDHLISLMENEKPFLNADFSMGDLCTMLKESRRKVTYVINDHMQSNFYGIVNDFRIKEAVALLSEDRHNHLKMEVIAEMVGFQSKSSFNACFKKYNGCTPSVFKASVSNHREVAAGASKPS